MPPPPVAENQKPLLDSSSKTSGNCREYLNDPRIPILLDDDVLERFTFLAARRYARKTSSPERSAPTMVLRRAARKRADFSRSTRRRPHATPFSRRTMRDRLPGRRAIPRHMCEDRSRRRQRCRYYRLRRRQQPTTALACTSRNSIDPP